MHPTADIRGFLTEIGVTSAIAMRWENFVFAAAPIVGSFTFVREELRMAFW